MIHRHIWKVLDKTEHPSAWEQMKGKPEIKDYDILAYFERPVIVTRECEICGTQEVRRV